jgi:NAD(P)-dependent dehydrogenase (short-subunit alcohol dehydrogenase family)
VKSVKGKNVLITGAAMGMGRLFAERAIAEGAAAVVLWDVDESTLNDTLAELADGPDAAEVEVSGYVVDVADAGAVADTAAEVLDEVGGSTCWSTTPASCAATSTSGRPTSNATPSSRSTSTRWHRCTSPAPSSRR